MEAIEISRRQQAKSLELRAAMSLSRFVAEEQGKKAEARRLLAEIYGWFTEGFDTADLRSSPGAAGGAIMTSLDQASIAELSARFSGVLLRPDASGYDEVRRVHNGMIDRRPALIAALPGQRRYR